MAKEPKSGADRSRRRLIQGAGAGAGALAAGLLGSDAFAGQGRPEPKARGAQKNPTARENEKPGDADWQLTRVRLDRDRGFRAPAIEGYCSRASIAAGQTLEVFVSIDPAGPFELEIFRMGYYRGKGARRVAKFGPIEGKTQPVPTPGPRRRIECAWEPSVSIPIPGAEQWPSGVYLGRLTALTDKRHQRWQNYVVFVVRDARRADVMVQTSDNTWQAYNRWPDDYSLYTDPRGSLVADVDVSFDRPYGKYAQIYENPQSVGSGEFLLWEFPLVYWLEREGYDVTYCSNHDMLDPTTPLRAKAWISVGHDEYWDPRQYESVKGAIERGVNVLFLSGNSVCFVAPYSPSSGGKVDRILTRAGRYGGLTAGETKYMGPFPTEGPNEGLLIGARTVEPFNGGDDWAVVKPEHWIFEGTGMAKGEAVPGLVGWEFHGNPAAIAGLEVLAEGDALNAGGASAHWTATIYPGPKGNFVFNASTIWWAQGLSSPPGHMLPWSHWVRPHGPDERVQGITANLLSRATRMNG